MKLHRLRRDRRGGVLVEYTLTIPVFLVMTFGLVQAGLLLWAQVGLQHGVEMAARCMSVNDAAIQANLNTSCFSPTAPTAVTSSTIQSYAAQNAYGLGPAASIFIVNQSATCGTVSGNQVSASYSFNLINYIFNLTLHAKSCYPS